MKPSATTYGRELALMLTALVITAASMRDNRAAERPSSQRPQPLDLGGHALDPFAGDRSRLRLFLFVAVDCPISNRYAPEMRRMYNDYEARGVDVWLVYPHEDATSAAIERHIEDYALPREVLRDPRHVVVKRARVAITPEAAVFRGRTLVYHGRIDNKFEDFGKARPEPTKREVRETLDALLAGKAPAVAATRAVGCSIPPLK